MTGMDAVTGRPLSGLDHLGQSIAKILTTPIGSRVMRRDFGSALFELLDAPMNGLTRLRAIAATASAIARWEPRIRLTRVDVARGEDPGVFAIQLEGEVADPARGSSLARFTIPLRPATA